MRQQHTMKNLVKITSLQITEKKVLLNNPLLWTILAYEER